MVDLGFYNWWYGNGLFNGKGQQLDQKLQRRAIAQALASGNLAQKFGRIRTMGYTDATGDMRGLAETAIQVNAAALGGMFVSPKSIVGLVKTAQQKYPNLAGKLQQHHITPQFLGGAATGPTVEIDAAYHQLITNRFRELWPYGQRVRPSADELTRIIKQVYSEYPLPK